MTLKEIPFLPVRYRKYPNNYFDRAKADDNWKTPRGIVEELPSGVKYVKLAPMLKTKEGKWIQNAYYNRKVKSANGVVEDYIISELSNEYGNAPGIIMGSLQGESFSKMEGDFETQFPFEHYLEVVYPVRLIDINHNPLSLEIRLAK